MNVCRAAGLDAVRVPLSGATEAMKGDVRVNHPSGRFALSGEVKARASFPAWILEFLGDNDFLVLVEDRREPLVIQRMSEWLKVAR